MHRRIRLFCFQRSVPLCHQTGLRHSSSVECHVSAAIGRANWNHPHGYRCRNLLHFVMQLVLAQKILRFWSFSCPAPWLSFSVSGHSGSWKYRGHFQRPFHPRSTPAHRHYLPHTGRFPDAPQSGRHWQRTSRAFALCSNGSVRPGSVLPCQIANAGFFLRPCPHRVSASSFWAWTARPSLSSGESVSFWLTFPL